MAEPRRERKVVTVLFADLVGFTARAEQLDPEDVEAILRPYHERLRGGPERFGGWGGHGRKFTRRCGPGAFRAAGRAGGRPGTRGGSRSGNPRLGPRGRCGA